MESIYYFSGIGIDVQKEAKATYNGMLKFIKCVSPTAVLVVSVS